MFHPDMFHPDPLVNVALVALTVTLAALLTAIVFGLIAFIRWLRRPVFDVEYGADRMEGPITEPIHVPVTTASIPVISPFAHADTPSIRARVARPRRSVLRSTTR